MFGICHWWAISPEHPWSKIIYKIQKCVSDNVCSFKPHITICTNSTIDFPLDSIPEKFFCITKVSQTVTESTEGTLWCLEIPIQNYKRPDGEPAHISLAYKWNKPFTPEDVQTASRMCKPMFGFKCSLFEHQTWVCNREPNTWKQLL